MSFCLGSKAHHFSRRLKSTNHSNMGIPTTFESNGIFENLKCHSGHHSISGIFRRGLVGIKTPSMTLHTEYFSQCNLAYILQAFNHVRCYCLLRITMHSRSNHHKSSTNNSVKPLKFHQNQSLKKFLGRRHGDLPKPLLGGVWISAPTVPQI